MTWTPASHHIHITYADRVNRATAAYRWQTQVSYHGDGEAPDAVDVLDAVLPGDETLDVDVKLVPKGLDCLVVLLIPAKTARTMCALMHVCLCTSLCDNSRLSAHLDEECLGCLSTL